MEDKHISFSQLSLYNNFCAFYYRLSYVDKLIPKEQNIFTMFGDCVHKTVDAKLTDKEIDCVKTFDDLFKQGFLSLPKTEIKKISEEENYKKIVISMKKDGAGLAQEAYDSIPKHFPTFSLLKSEQELNVKLKENLSFKGFIDLILVDKEAKKFIIADWKTTSWGWDAEAKSDKWKIYQLSLYKHFIAQELGIPLEDIETYFILIKRTAKKDRIEYLPISNTKKRISNALKVLDDTIKNIEMGNFPMNKESCNKCRAKGVYCFPNPLDPASNKPNVLNVFEE